MHTAAQVRALVSPARQELVDALDGAGPCSVAQLAALLGRPADALYHHLRRLVAVGLVAETARRKEGRHAFAVYDLVSRPLQLRRDASADVAGVVAVMGAAQRLAWRNFRRALVAGDGTRDGPQRTLWGARARGWLTPAALERVNRLLDELLASLRSRGPTEGLVPVSLSFLLAPAPPAGRGRPANSRPARSSRRSARRATPQTKGPRP